VRERRKTHGAMAARWRRRRPQLPGARRALTLVYGLMGLAALGTVLLSLPFSSTHAPLTLLQALFTSVSAVSGTGLSVIVPGSDLSWFGQFVLMLLMEFGGIGYALTAIVVFRLLGKRVTFQERLTFRDSLALTSARSVLSLSVAILAGILVIEAVGALLLWLNWMRFYGVGWAAWYAVFHSVASFTNSGFDIFVGSAVAQSAPPADLVTVFVMAGLIWLGSIGLPVVSDLLAWPRRRRFTLHTRVTLITAGVLILAGTIGFLVSEARPPSTFTDAPFWQRLLYSFYYSVASRSAGLVLVPAYTAMTDASVLVMACLMFVGASPAAMGGGITTSTFAVLVLAMWSFGRGQRELRAGRRVIPFETLQKAAVILIAALFLNAVVTWLLLLTQEISLQAALVETVSAFGTVGFSLGATASLNVVGQIIIILLMFCGRLGTLTILIVLARPQVPAAIEFPEERILIG
jgi:trk system potassium uptake protein TrkH